MIEAARQHPEVFAALLTKPWVADDITAAETDAIYGLSRTPLFSEGFIEGMLEMSWAQDDITIDEGKTVGYLYRAIRWAPEISDELLAYPWLEPAVTPEVAAAVEYLYRLPGIPLAGTSLTWLRYWWESPGSRTASPDRKRQ